MLDYQFFLIPVFIIGYILLVFENEIRVNKAATALLTGMFLWVIYLNFSPAPFPDKLGQLYENLSEISQLLLFLIGAMTIVELIVSHRGFELIKHKLLINSPQKLFWVISWIGFWVSSALDNLTTILILVSILSQIVHDKKLRRLMAAGLVFVVNVGGAWTPIGDVTTTMLWIKGNVNTFPLIMYVGLPSILSLLTFVTLFSYFLPKEKIKMVPHIDEALPFGTKRVFYLGIASFIAVPFFKLLLGIPPFMGMMISLGGMWVMTDWMHHGVEERKQLRVQNILTKIDISCILFFLGILLAVSCLDSAGILDWIGKKSVFYTQNPFYFNLGVGFLSAIIDNVPLVAGVIKMFDNSVYPPDHIFWFLNAYCAGVGGSLLIIGSAPGVALMSLKNIPFLWYLKTVSWIVLISYLTGWGGIYLMSLVLA